MSSTPTSIRLVIFTGESPLEKVSSLGLIGSTNPHGVGAFGNVKYSWLKRNPNAKVAIKAMKKVDII